MRKRDVIQPIAPEALAPCDPVTVAPINSDGKPDLYNYMPTRLVPRAEAAARGWQFFFEGTPCRYGHTAPRYVSNERQCVDCKRTKAGKAPIGGQARAEWKAPPRKQPDSPAKAAGALVVAQRAPEPDTLEKRFLVNLADVRDFEKAAQLSGTSVAHWYGRLSWSAPFKQAVEELEQRLGIPRTIVVSGPYEWDNDKRARFIEVYIDTGEMASARDAIRVTPSEFFREVKRNSDFHSQVSEAAPLAMRAMEDVAFRLAKSGNDKLLQQILKAKMPEYKESMKVDLNVMERLTDEQLDNRIAQLTAKYGNVVEGQIIEAVTQREDEATGGSSGEGSESLPKSIRDLL